MEEDGKVFYRFGKNSTCYAMSIETMLEILPRHKDLRKKFLTFKQKTIIQNKPFPLDYIMALPRHLKKNQQHSDDFEKAQRLENILKNVVIRRLTEIRALKSKPSLKDMISEYMKKKNEKDERARVRIKEQVLQIYEQKTFEQFTEQDPNFNKIIVHIERVLKITTAQTLAIDSLERKITNLSKRNPVQQNDLILPKQDDKIKALLEKKEREKEKQEGSDSGSDSNGGKKQKKAEAKFQDFFPDIQEDNFESSDDEEEKKKNERLERLGQVAAPLQKKGNEANETIEGLIDGTLGQGEGDAGDDKSSKSSHHGVGAQQSKNILIGENGDILARYRIPVENNQVDFALQLPTDSDSSNISDEND